MNRKNAGVETLHPEYIQNYPIWEQVDDCLGGSLRVKERTTTYLPNPEGSKEYEQFNANPDWDEELSSYYSRLHYRNMRLLDARYNAYIMRAMFYNFTRRTLSGLVGAVFRKEPEIELDPAIEQLLTDVDGNGTTLTQQAKSTYGQVMAKGRAGLLVDLPINSDSVSRDDVASGRVFPRIIPYRAQDITNWKTQRIGAKTVLTMVTLKEYIDSGDIFSHDSECQYRVLMLDENGNYVQRVYQEGAKDEYLEFPVILNGSPVKEILFYFAGSEENDFTVDGAPMYDLSCVNIAHYRNSADNEESSFLCGQPTLVVSPSEMFGDARQWNEANPNGVTLGSRQGLNVGAGGSASLLQASENNLAKQNMRDKEEQAVAIGADLITPTSQETAEAARIKKAADTSVAASCANNVSTAYTKALNACSMVLGSTRENLFTLNTDFFLSMMTAQDRAQWAADVNMGLLPKETYYAAMRRSGLIDETDEELADGLEANEFGVVKRSTNNPTWLIPPVI